MAMRNIIEIDEEKCNGCGKCVTACAEGAIQMVDGKAKLVADVYCDGLGACIGDCPVDALKVVQRDADEFDEEKVNERLVSLGRPPMPTSTSGSCPSVQSHPVFAPSGGCPGSMARSMTPKATATVDSEAVNQTSQLAQWPVQLHLVSPQAPYFRNGHLLVVADCVPIAFPGFHQRMLKGNPIVIACPKLDDTSPYVDKLTDIIKLNELTGISVAHMEVPCCTGIRMMVEKAREQAGIEVPVTDIIIGIDGEIRNEEQI